MQLSGVLDLASKGGLEQSAQLEGTADWEWERTASL